MSTLSQTGSKKILEHPQHQHPAMMAMDSRVLPPLTGWMLRYLTRLLPGSTTGMTRPTGHRLTPADYPIDPPDCTPTYPTIHNTAFTSTVHRLMNDQSLLNRLLPAPLPFMRVKATDDLPHGRAQAKRIEPVGATAAAGARPMLALYAFIPFVLTLMMGLTATTKAVAQSINLSVRQVAAPKKPLLNAPVGYTIVVKNSGPEAAANVVVRDSLPTGGTTFSSINVTRGSGVTTSAPAQFIDISIPGIAPNDSVVLNLNLTVVGEGVWFNKVEVITAPGTDINSDPGNHSLVEDDYDATCFAVPLTWYDGDEFTVAIPSGYTDIKWYRYGTQITTPTDSAVVNADGTLTIKGPGTYSFSTTRGGCTTGNCCDIIVVPGPVASLGNFVFEDKNGNGIQDPGETGIAGVTVTLYLNGAVAQTTLTNTSGIYSFTGLVPGSGNTYQLGFTAPTGYTATLANAGGNDAIDSDVDPVTGRTDSFTVTNTANTLVDAGFYRPASISSSVFADNNRNGIQDAGDGVLPGVTVTLVSNGSVVTSTVTDPNGVYSFTGLTPGVSYSVGFTTPTNYTVTTPLSGTDKTIDSDVLASGLTASFTLASGETNTGIDAGYQGVIVPPTTTSLGDLVFEDKNGNGIQDPGETGIAGVTVTLLGGNAPVSVLTDGSGIIVLRV